MEIKYCKGVSFCVYQFIFLMRWVMGSRRDWVISETYFWYKRGKVGLNNEEKCCALCCNIDRS